MTESFGERSKNISSHRGAGVEIREDVFLGFGNVIGDGCRIGSRTKIWHYNNLIGFNVIGEDCKIGCYTQLDPRVTIGNRTNIQNGVGICTDAKIGDGVYIAPGVLFCNSKYPPSERFSTITVGDGVVIGGNVTILPGLRIGSNSVIDAGSVVTKDIPEDEEWRGSPARFLRSKEKYDAAKALWEESI